MLPDSFIGQIAFLLEKYGSAYLNGAKLTLILALVGTLFGCLIGFICGIVQTIPLEKNDNILKKFVVRFSKFFIAVYVEYFRGTPMMAQAGLIYYGLQYAGYPISVIAAGFFVISINTGAYMAETMRGGIFSVENGQTEAAKAIGMNHFQTMLFVILPQAIRNIMPQIGNNFIINIKDSSVLSVISTVELMFTARSVSGTYYTYFQSMVIACAIYLTMTVISSRLLRLLEKRIDGADNYDLSTTDTLAHTSGMNTAPTKHL